MNTILFGIPNCDTVKRSRDWLASHGFAYEFHDYKKVGVDRGMLARWVGEHGWEVVLNRAGTTFRKLADRDKVELNAEKAIDLMLAQPSMIKRPIVEVGDRRLIGFKPEEWARLFGV